MRTLPILLSLVAANAWSSIIADSVSGFSSVQGQNGWTYRYYDKTKDTTPASYNYLTESPLMTEYRTTHSFSGAGTGPAWYVKDGTYWTMLGQSSGHGNGLVTSGGRAKEEQFAVRRWTSTYSGAALITGSIAKYKSLDATNTTGGNGVQLYLVINGIFTKALVIGAADQVGGSFSVTTNIHVGDAIEWWVDPYQADDRADLSSVRGQVSSTPEPGMFVFFGLSAGWIAKRSRRAK